MTAFAVLLVTTSSAAESRRIAGALLKERLAACVNVLPGVLSRYWWKGKIASGREQLLLIKTSRAKAAAVARRVKALHSYTVPEVLALPVLAGDPDYLRWLKDSVR